MREPIRPIDTRPFAPESYWLASREVRDQVTNGCGPKGWKVDLVPDTIWGLSIKEECQIHDWEYAVAPPTIEAKDSADRTFLNNILRKVEYVGGWLKWLRRRRAVTYYETVHLFGGPAFWTGKNNLKENV